MTTERPDLISESMALYDINSGEPVLVERAFDVTEHFKKIPYGEELILGYATTTHGEIVQMTNPYLGEKYGGSHIHLQVNDVRDGNPVTLDTLVWRGRVWGIDPELLAEIIVTHATHDEQ